MDSISQKILNYMALKLEITGTYFSHIKFIYQMVPHAGIKIFNNLPTQICCYVILISLKKLLRISYSYIHFILQLNI